MYIVIKAMEYLLEYTFRLYLYDPTKPKIEVNIRNNGKISLVKINFIFDPEGKRIIDMFYVSNKELGTIRKIVVPLAEKAWRAILSTITKEKKVMIEQALLGLIKGILLSKLKQKLKIPAILLTLYILTEIIRTSLKEEITIKHNAPPSRPNKAMEEDEISSEIPDII